MSKSVKKELGEELDITVIYYDEILRKRMSPSELQCCVRLRLSFGAVDFGSIENLSQDKLVGLTKRLGTHRQP